MLTRLFSKSLRCSRLFPGGVDAHCHLLPGVDDGAPHEEAALGIISAQQKAGLAGAICTPHIMASLPGNTEETLRAAFAAFEARAAQAAPGFCLQLAAEYMLDERFEAHLSTPENLLTWPAPAPLPGSPAAAAAGSAGAARAGGTVSTGCTTRPHLLVELPQYMLPPGWADMLEAVLAAGITPVLAHPERYHRLLDEADLMRLHQRGVRLQGNIGSLCGYYSEASRALADKLNTHSLYSWWGTDAHTTDIFTHIKLRP